MNQTTKRIKVVMPYKRKRIQKNGSENRQRVFRTIKVPHNSQMRQDMNISDGCDHKSYIVVVTEGIHTGYKPTPFAINSNDIETPLESIKKRFFTGTPWPRDSIAFYLLPGRKNNERFFPKTQYLGNNLQSMVSRLEARYNKKEMSSVNSYDKWLDRPRVTRPLPPSQFGRD